MKLNFLNKRAETVIEVVVALFVIGIGLAVSSILTNRVMHLMNHSRLHSQGRLLAMEGIEAVQNIVHTNLLRYSDDDCWRTYETSPICNASSPKMGSQDKYFSTHLDITNFTWELYEESSALQDDEVRFQLTSDYRLANKVIPSVGSPILTKAATGDIPSIYYREILVEDMGDNDFLTVHSTVKWSFKNKVYEYTAKEDISKP